LAKAALLHSPRLTSAFIEWRALLPDRPRNALYTFSFNDTLRLHLSIGDATCGPLPDQAIDAVYLDGFSPDVNPELWTAPFLKEIAGTMKTGGRLATYSARGLVRRNLTEAGFDVQKAPGPPGKREMLLATRL
jgi:tRNA U34 5-methylaminomethyl-2-thiouridine-forming methyltransferase MnmC